MAMELVDIHPQFLKFIFEVRKQSSCTIQLTNKTDQFVAFKVKTTTPKKYCVRPNVGVIKPRGASDFTVTMQAQSIAPPDLQCKDKFLIQCTVVPFGLTEENITSDMFIKDSSKHIEDKKMKVILVAATSESPGPVPPSPRLASPTIDLPKQEVSYDVSTSKDKAGVDNLLPPQKNIITEEPRFIKEPEPRPLAEEPESVKEPEPRPVDEQNDLPMGYSVEPRESIKLNEEKIANIALDPKLTDEVDELTSKLNDLGSKLTAAEETISQLMEEKSIAMREKQLLEQELMFARKKNRVKKVYMGYPGLYVCMVGIISLIFGYLIHQ